MSGEPAPRNPPAGGGQLLPSPTVDGGRVVYEILSDSGDFIVLTPGGRFEMDIPGLRPLADALVDGGSGGARDSMLRGPWPRHRRSAGDAGMARP